MAQTASKFYTVLVVGDNPEQLMEKYKIGETKTKHLMFKYLDSEKTKNNTIKMYEQLLDKSKEMNLTKFQIDSLAEKLKSIKNMSSFEYYQAITYGCTYDENGDAWSNINPNGKWVTFQKGGHFSTPLITYEEKETTQELNCNINWNALHLANTKLYERVWEIIIEGDEPKNKDEEIIKINMSDKDAYFENFKNKEDYVLRNSSFWTYAFLDENGWVDADDAKNDSIWINEYYNRFITKLEPTSKITIFEFTRNSDE